MDSVPRQPTSSHYLLPYSAPTRLQPCPCSAPCSAPCLLALWLLPLAADGAGVSCVRVFVCETLCVLARLHINKQFFRCIRLFATRNLWTEQARLQLWALVLLACQKCSRNCFDIYKYHLHSVCLTTVL